MSKKQSLKLNKIQVVILVGGYGKRLKHLTKKTPKPIIQIQKKPFLFYLLKYLINQGLSNFLFLAGYKGKQLENYLNENFKIKGIKINIYTERKPMGTGYALKKAFNKLEKNFLLLNGDTFTNLKFKNFLKNVDSNKIINISVTKKKSNTSGNFFIKKNKTIFIEKPKKTSGLINCGIYFVNKKITKIINKKENSLEKNIIPKLVKNNNAKLLKSNIELFDIGTFIGIKNYEKYLYFHKYLLKS